MVGFVTLAAWPRLRVAGTMVATDPWRRRLAAIVAASTLLNLIGIWWGLPSMWAGDEISPRAVWFSALTKHFSGGWFDRYPPLQFYLLTVVLSPWTMLKSLVSAHPSGHVDWVVELVLSRLLSIAAGIGTLVAIYASGALVFGKRAGLLAAAMMALVAPFVFYAKTANPEIPYVFWIAMSLFFYLRFLRTLASKDVVFFAATATFAICTKDQAYGLYLAAPLVIGYHLWESYRDRGDTRPFLRALLDRRLVLSALTATGLFVVIYNIPFNWEGFVRHVVDITGAGSRGYRAVEPTLEQRSWGWPFWIITLIGAAVGLLAHESRRAAVCLVVLVISYYLGFINVILYNYDRYLLPVFVVQAIFGGVALDRFLGSAGTRPSWRHATVIGVFAYTLLYVGAIDVLMIRDSRYAAERWLRDHVNRDDIIGTMFPMVVLPRLDDFHVEDVGSIEELDREAPAFYVLNADYARAIPPDSPGGRVIAGLQNHTLGYSLAFRDRSPAPWPWLPAEHPDLVGPRLGIPLSFLRDINPETEIYERDRPAEQKIRTGFSIVEGSPR
jgi:hypothetical protein